MPLNHVALTVGDRERSAAFYAEHFGLTERVHDDPHLLILGTPDGSLLALSEGEVPRELPRGRNALLTFAMAGHHARVVMNGNVLGEHYGIRLPFSFDVPFDCEPTSGTASWRLLLESRDGAHGQSVPVPVAQTATSSPAQTRQALRAATYDAPAETKVQVERGAGTTVRLPLPSWVRLWYTLVVVVAAMCVGAAIIWPEDAATIYGIAIVITIVLCAIPLPALAMTVRRIDADWRGLTLRYQMLRRAKSLPAGDVGAAYAHGALHYELTFSGAVPPWTIVTLRSRAEAEWVAYELRLPQRS